jgi:hypothetical protein
VIAVPWWLAAVFALVAVFQSVPWLFLLWMVWEDRRALASEVPALDELRDGLVRAFPGATAYGDADGRP